MENVGGGDPNVRTLRSQFANYPPRMTESVMKNYDVYEALPHPKEEIIQNDYTCPPRRFIDKKASKEENIGSVIRNRNTRVSSKTEDYDPDKLSLKVVKNQINHLDFKPELFKYESIRHI